jgi:hypothetical protein
MIAPAFQKICEGLTLQTRERTTKFYFSEHTREERCEGKLYLFENGNSFLPLSPFLSPFLKCRVKNIPSLPFVIYLSSQM